MIFDRERYRHHQKRSIVKQEWVKVVIRKLIIDFSVKFYTAMMIVRST